MTTKQKVIISIVLLAGAFAAGRFSLPAKIVEKEHIVYQDRIVESKSVATDTTKNDNKVYTRTTTETPDGTKTTTVKITNNDQIDSKTTSKSNETNTIASDTTKEKTIEYSKDSLLISAAAKTNFTNPSLSYGGIVNKRVLGPIYLGAFGFSDASFGMSVGLSF